MELDFSTFLLEIVNFLILVWLLKRFLYQPVLAVVERRKAAVDKTLANADEKVAEAKALEQRYQGRLAEWEQKKKELQDGVASEMTSQRDRMMEELQVELAGKREQERVLAERRQQELRRRAEAEGALLAGRFAARLLGRVSSSELEAKLVQVALEDLRNLSDSQRDALRSALAAQAAEVVSAYPLSTAQRTEIEAALQRVAGRDVTATYRNDAALLAGLRISASPWTVRANLQDELAFFAEMARDDSEG